MPSINGQWKWIHCTAHYQNLNVVQRHFKNAPVSLTKSCGLDRFLYVRNTIEAEGIPIYKHMYLMTYRSPL